MEALEGLLDNGDLDNLDVVKVMNQIKEKVKRQRESMNYYFKPCIDIIRLVTSEEETKEINDNLRYANLNFNTRHKHNKKELTEAAELRSKLHTSFGMINHWFYDYPLTDKSFKSRFRKILKKVIRPFLLYQTTFNVRFTRLLNDFVRLYDSEIIENIQYNAHIVRTLNTLVKKMFKADQIFVEWADDLSRALYQFMEGKKTEIFGEGKIKTKMFKEYIQTSQKRIEELYTGLSNNNNSIAEVRKTINLFNERVDKETTFLEEFIQTSQKRIEELYTGLSNSNNSIAEVHKTINLFNERVDKETTLLREYIEKNVGEINNVFSLKTNQITELYQQINKTNGQIESIHNHLNSHTEETFELQKRLDKVCIDIDKELDERVKEYQNIQLTIKSIKNKLSEFQVEQGKLISGSLSEKTNNRRPKGITDSYQTVPNFDFYAFEEWARGSEEFVISQQEDYVKFFVGKSNVLDIGCGRGEFLELLRKKGVESYGIDVDINMISHCKEKKLKVLQADALSHIKSLEDNSLGGVFAGQLIEHLTTSDLITLIELIYDKLIPDSLIILETVNPTNLTTFSGSFYADPTHIKPVHPVTLEFFMEKAGFRDINIHYSVPFPAENKLKEFAIPDSIQDYTRNFFTLYNENVKKLNQVLFGYANYAMIGYK